MKIGFLVGSVSREAGGLFQSVRGLAKAVMSKDTTARVFGISDKKSAVDSLAWQPLSVYTFQPRFRAWGYSNQLLPALFRADLDILSTHGLWKYCSVASHQWHRRTGRPYIVHSHGMLERWALQNAKWKKQIAALLYEHTHLRDAACLRALCEAEAQSIRAYGMRSPICIIPNGVDLPELVESSAVEVESPLFQKFAQGRKVLLYLGRLHPKKNVASLIRAWKQTLNSDRPISESWVLAIVGWDQGGYDRTLKQLANDRGLLFADVSSDRTELSRQQSTAPSLAFLGPQFGAEKNACYRACDAFILPSLSEGLPMTVLEAWAYGKPVVMTPECNLPEGFAAGAALQIGTTPEEIAAGLKQLNEMSDDDRRTMGARGRSLVATKFSWPRIGEQMRLVYDWVLGGGPTPRTVRL
ncbi:MAG: glycosyl transferase family 1 [Verrucomicrobia bacterium]|nr:MAG: glycosyl transferase family 1 [Verrucomicrobiota bacterium]